MITYMCVTYTDKTKLNQLWPDSTHRSSCCLGCLNIPGQNAFKWQAIISSNLTESVIRSKFKSHSQEMILCSNAFTCDIPIIYYKTPSVEHFISEHLIECVSGWLWIASGSYMLVVLGEVLFRSKSPVSTIFPPYISPTGPMKEEKTDCILIQCTCIYQCYWASCRSLGNVHHPCSWKNWSVLTRSSFLFPRWRRACKKILLL